MIFEKPSIRSGEMGYYQLRGTLVFGAKYGISLIVFIIMYYVMLKGYDYGSFTYFNIVKYKLLNKIEKQ